MCDSPEAHEVKDLTVEGGDPILALFSTAVGKLGGEGAESVAAALTVLVNLREQVQREEARKAFNSAMVDFQLACPAIRKDGHANVPTRDGGGYKYDYATMNEIVRVVKPLLNSFGIAYSLDQTFHENRMHVAFTLRHRDGHEQTSRFSCPEDSKSAASSQQKSGIADTYAARRAMRHALGILDDTDTDGVPPEGNVDVIDDEQLRTLQSLVEEVQPDMEKFNEYCGGAIERLPKAKYAQALSSLQEIRRRRAEPGGAA